MAALAHIVRAEAEVDSDVAAVDALPIDVLSSMFFTDSLSSSIGLHLALFAQQVFFLGRVLHLQLSLAVLKTTKVRLLAASALVESALLHSECKHRGFVCVAL